MVLLQYLGGWWIALEDTPKTKKKGKHIEKLEKITEMHLSFSLIFQYVALTSVKNTIEQYCRKMISRSVYHTVSC